MNETRRIIIILFAFSVAMGFLEAAVVIYLRMMFYPGGFHFPLVPISAEVARLEFLREAATMVMLVTVGMLAGKTRALRLAFFLFCFGVWDIFFYITLKVFLDWPASLFTWDILFLIPVPWVGPVVTPVIVSLTMIVFTFSIVYHSAKGGTKIGRLDLASFAAGGLIIIISFAWDYSMYVIRSGNALWTPLSKQQIFTEIANYMPKAFNWPLFALGEMLVIFAIVQIFRKAKTNSGN